MTVRLTSEISRTDLEQYAANVKLTMLKQRLAVNKRNRRRSEPLDCMDAAIKLLYITYQEKIKTTTG